MIICRIRSSATPAPPAFARMSTKTLAISDACVCGVGGGFGKQCHEADRYEIVQKLEAMAETDWARERNGNVSVNEASTGEPCAGESAAFIAPPTSKFNVENVPSCACLASRVIGASTNSPPPAFSPPSAMRRVECRHRGRAIDNDSSGAQLRKDAVIAGEHFLDLRGAGDTEDDDVRCRRHFGRRLGGLCPELDEFVDRLISRMIEEDKAENAPASGRCEQFHGPSGRRR